MLSSVLRSKRAVRVNIEIMRTFVRLRRMLQANAELTKTLGRVLGRPTFVPVPAVALRIAFGEVADALLASTRMRPERLLETGYRFRYPELEEALRHVLGRPA